MQARKWLLSAAVVAAAAIAAPRTASADWVVTPFVGWNAGGSANVNGSDGSTTATKFEHKIDYGVSLSSMGKGAIGGEIDFGYSANFFATNTNNNGFQFTNNSN